MRLAGIVLAVAMTGCDYRVPAPPTTAPSSQPTTQAARVFTPEQESQINDAVIRAQASGGIGQLTFNGDVMSVEVGYAFRALKFSDKQNLATVLISYGWIQGEKPRFVFFRDDKTNHTVATYADGVLSVE